MRFFETIEAVSRETRMNSMLLYLNIPKREFSSIETFPIINRIGQWKSVFFRRTSWTMQSITKGVLREDWIFAFSVPLSCIEKASCIYKTVQNSRIILQSIDSLAMTFNRSEIFSKINIGPRQKLFQFADWFEHPSPNILNKHFETNERDVDG